MVDSAVLGVCVWHARDALLLKTDAPHIHTWMRDFDRTPTSAGFWGVLGPRRAERRGSSISRRTKAQRHLFYALSAPQILFRASRPRRLVGVASSVAFPLFGWGCSSYRRTWGCVKCGAASAASWRSRVAARHCYYGPPVSVLAKLLRSTCAALSDAIVALANGDHCLSERGELSARPMDLSNIPARSLKIAAAARDNWALCSAPAR